MIDGIWWFVILLIVVAVLWLIAYLRGKPLKDANGQTSKAPANDNLHKTLTLLKRYYPDYQVSRRANHLLLTKSGIKVAMITIDKSVAVGHRRLGDVPIINYHRPPSRAQLSASLQQSE